MKVAANNKLSKIIVVGDRVLIKPKGPSDKTRGGLYLPQGVHEKERVQSGYVMKVGPGYPMPFPSDSEVEPWKEKDENIKYIPLQAKEGDLAIFIQNSSYEVIYQDEKYFIVPHSAILLLERDEELFG
jgi:chaperonin GroES